MSSTAGSGRPDPSGPGSGQVRVAWAWAVPSAQADPLLSARERERLARTASAAARDRFASGRALARSTIASELGLPAAEVVLDLPPGARRGKPSLRGDALALSIAHSGRLVVVATSASGPVGVDVERIRPVVGGVADRVLSPIERARHATSLASLSDADLLTYWCRKEAVLKCVGTGLTRAPRTLTVTPPGERAGLLDAGSLHCGPLLVRDVEVHGSYRCALAVGRDRVHVVVTHVRLDPAPTPSHVARGSSR